MAALLIHRNMSIAELFTAGTVIYHIPSRIPETSGSLMKMGIPQNTISTEINFNSPMITPATFWEDLVDTFNHYWPVLVIIAGVVILTYKINNYEVSEEDKKNNCP